jgi:hypothetical protein
VKPCARPIEVKVSANPPFRDGQHKRVRGRARPIERMRNIRTVSQLKNPRRQPCQQDHPRARGLRHNRHRSARHLDLVGGRPPPLPRRLPRRRQSEHRTRRPLHARPAASPELDAQPAQSPALAPALPAPALARPLAPFVGLWCRSRHGCSRGPGLRGCPDLRGACCPAPLHLPDQGVHAGQPRGVQGPVHQGDGGSSDRRRGAAAEHVATAARSADAHASAITGQSSRPEPRPQGRVSAAA